MAQNDMDGESPSDIEEILDGLTVRAKTLLSELEEFRYYLRGIKQEQHIEVSQFRNSVNSELNMLERLRSKTDNYSTTHHIARSSNLPFFEACWSHAKASRNLTAMVKRVYFDSSSKSIAQSTDNLHFDEKRSLKALKNSAVNVDFMIDGGRTWSKVSLVTNHRLLFDLAKQGWTGTSDDDYSDEEDGRKFDDSDEDSEVPLLKLAKDLRRAAESYRVRTRIPQVRLILPRLQEGQTSGIDAILNDIRKAGISVICGEDAMLTPPPLEIAFRNMVPNPVDVLSDTLNIDCTILLAIVSDFSHAKVSKEPWFHTALQRQVEIEGNENLLPSLLYPALRDRKMICTREAAVRMREIVNTLGTPTEAARTCILMGDDASLSQEALVKQMQELSAYDVPAEWQLPIAIVDQNANDCQSRLGQEAREAGTRMTPINQSVFLYGWASGHTTITSNRAVVKQIDHYLEECKDLDSNAFPSIWLCPTARSLVGKEKRGAKKDESKETAWHLPDPLRREQQRRHGLDVLSQRAGHAVEDRRPNGYDSQDVLEAKKASTKDLWLKRSEIVEDDQEQ
jgi:hypothetical protein